MRYIAPTAAVAVIALALLPAGAHAAKPWGAAQTVSRHPGGAGVTVDPQGLAVLAWGAQNSVYGARRTPRRGFGEPFLLRRQDHALGLGDVALDAGGDTLVAVRRFLTSNHRIEGLTIRASGSRTRPISLSGPGSSAYSPTFAAVAPGDSPPAPALTWWRREAGRLQLARAIDGRLLVSENDTLEGASGARYALGADGTLYAAATTATGVRVAARPPGGRFGAPVVLAAGPGPFNDADIAIGRDGTLAVIWRQWDGHTYRLMVAERSPNAPFRPAQALSRPGERAVAPHVVITADGRVRAAYLSTAPGSDRLSRRGALRLVSPGAAPVTVTARSQEADEVALGADGKGGVTLAWTRYERGHAGGAVFARVIMPTDGLGRRRQLTSAGEDGRGLALGLGTAGDAVVAWSTDARLRAARRPATG